MYITYRVGEKTKKNFNDASINYLQFKYITLNGELEERIVTKLYRYIINKIRI